MAEKKTDDYINGMFDFIDNSPTCFHAVEQAGKRLEQAGFKRLYENQKWEIGAGGKYYVNRNGSSLIAFSIPERMKTSEKTGGKKEGKEDGAKGGFHIVAAHSDSPCFKIKEIAGLTTEGRYVKWNVEKYGGMILSTWLDRPLSIAGKVVIRTKGGLESRLVNVDRNVAVIPNVAIHMNFDMNKGVEYNPQTDMTPLVGEILTKPGEEEKRTGQKETAENAENAYRALLAEEADVPAEDILGEDIFLYNRDKCSLAGVHGEFICGPRLDDLACVYAGLEAMCAETAADFINLFVIFDNEEVGSGTKQGADSTFLKDVLARIRFGLQMDEEQYRCMLADSFLISADNAHALHPNHPEKADAKNRPCLNGGVVIKYHGMAKYATDAYSGAVIKELCRKAEVPFQVYANRSDIAGGSTLGNILMSQVSMNGADVGLPQLAMHSAYETAGAKDVEYLIRMLRTFYRGR